MPVKLLFSILKKGVHLPVFFTFFHFQRFFAVFLVLFRFYEVFGVPRGVIFGTCLAENRFLSEKVGPSFLHTFTMFWLDFQGLQLPGGSKKRDKKQLVRMTMF